MYPDYNMYNFYGFDNFNFRGDINFQNPNGQNTYNSDIITLNQAIDLIRQSVSGEKEDEIFYDILIKQAPTEKEKDIITSIRNDERKHNNILRDLYYNFTGNIIPQDISEPSIDKNLSYQQNLEKALFGELDAVVRYRKILGTMPSGNSYTLLMSIMTDELRHASKYNFLIHIAK